MGPFMQEFDDISYRVTSISSDGLGPHLRQARFATCWPIHLEMRQSMYTTMVSGHTKDAVRPISPLLASEAYSLKHKTVHGYEATITLTL
jgi:hypothetical protein